MNVLPTAPPMKLLPLLIMEVLRKYTDEDCHLSQSEIRQMLYVEYGLQPDRKTAPSPHRVSA